MLTPKQLDRLPTDYRDLKAAFVLSILANIVFGIWLIIRHIQPICS